MTLIRFLKQYFSSFRGRTAFFYTDPEQAEPAKVTTEELERDIRRAAAFWESWGRGRKSRSGGSFRIGIASENSYAYLAEYLGIIASGNTVIPLNQSFSPEPAERARSCSSAARTYRSMPGSSSKAGRRKRAQTPPI